MEHRKNYFLGIAPGEWLQGIVVVLALAAGYGKLIAVANGADDRSRQNTTKLEGLESKMSKQIKESEQRTRKEIQLSEQRTREDIRDLRVEIRRILRDRK